MRRFQLHPIISHTQIKSHPKVLNFSSLTTPHNTNNDNNNFIPQNHNLDYVLSLLKTNQFSRQLTKQIHSQLTTNASLTQISNTDTLHLFNTLLRHYALGDTPHDAFSLFKQIKTSPFSPVFDSFTYSFLVKSCGNLRNKNMGFVLHGKAFQMGYESNVYVQTALVNMYVDVGLLGFARNVFDEMSVRNLVTWNVLVTGLVKWGYIEDAVVLFWQMPVRNIVSWTGMIDGCTRVRDYFQAFSLFRKMIRNGGFMPSEVTLLAIFPSIANLGDDRNCQVVHGYSEKSGIIASDSRVVNCLIDTYAKCGCIESSLRVFEELSSSRRNLVSWTSIICGFAMHGMANEAMDYFDRMEKFGFIPNLVTFLGILNACSHSGLVEEGLWFFRRLINDFQLVPDIKIFGCVIDMLGRAGKLKDAEEIASEIPDHVDNVIIWRTLLSACSFHGDVEMAGRVTRRMQEIEKNYGGDYVVMSNILTGQGKFNEAENIRKLMDDRNVCKIPAHSLG